MAAQLARVAGQVGVALVGVVGRRRVEEGVERHLGVDHDRCGRRPAGPPGRVAACASPSSRRWTCSSKSQRSTSPASSTARRRWSSPQRPRTWGRRSAVDSDLGLAAQPVGGLPHVEDLLVELALPGRPGVLEVVELVAEPVEALHHLAGRAWSTIACPMPVDVRRSRARPEHAHGAPEREPDREHQQQRHRVHDARGSQGPPTTLVTVSPMRHIRHSWTAVAAVVALAPCSPDAPARARRSRRAATGTGTTRGPPRGSSTPTDAPVDLEPTTDSTSSPTSGTSSLLTFSPKSGGQHSRRLPARSARATTRPTSSTTR